MEKKILITGATGLIGQRLVKELIEQGAFVKILTTSPEKAKHLFKQYYTKEIYEWAKYDDPVLLYKLVEDVDSIINLAGANVAGKRWTKEYKQIIYDSRIDSTKLLADSISLCDNVPESFINASAIGIYGFRGEEILTENSELGNDFLAQVCKEWENEALESVQYGVRVVNIRTGIVLDESEGAMKEIMKPYRFNLGVYQGNGKQWFSWIHIDDIINIYLYALQNSKVYGAINGTSPEPVTNKKFIESISEIMNVKVNLPVPEFVLRIVVGEFAKNLCTGQKVLPKDIKAHGFKFKYSELKPALENLLLKN